MTHDYFKDLNRDEAYNIAECLTRKELLYWHWLSDWEFYKNRSRLDLEQDIFDGYRYSSKIRKELLNIIQAPNIRAARKIAHDKDQRYWKSMSLEQLQRSI